MNIHSKIRYGIFFIILIVMMLLVFGKASFKLKSFGEFFTSGSNSQKQDTVTYPVLPSPTTQTNQDGNINSDVKTTTKDSSSSHYEWPTISGSPANREEMDQWLYSRGYTSSLSGKDEEYKSYSLETLKTLADGGDIHAMTALAAKIHDRAQSTKLIKRAAVYGSTEALQLLALRSDTNYDLAEYEGKLSVEDKRKLLLESMAYNEVAVLRGDKVTWYYGESSFKNSRKIDFTETEWQQIKERAQVIYNELQQQRTELGLGEFDNSVPDSVKKYADILTAPKSKNSCNLPENKAECDRLLAEIKNKGK